MKAVIVGNHAAGLSAAETLRANDPDCAIVVISKEDVPPYSRPLIPHLVSGVKTVKDILCKPSNFYEERSIETRFGIAVEKILVESKEVQLAGGEKVSYDALILANGAAPSMPRIPGVGNKGVFPFRTLEDAQNVADYCREEKVESAVVLGGGCVGLKSAEALKNLGLTVRVMVASPHILSQTASSEEAIIFEEHLAEKGIECVTGTAPKAILGDGRVSGVETAGGETFDCQLVIAAKGVRANLDIVEGTGIETDFGILVDQQCRTNVPDVYAAGDVAQNMDVTRGERWTNSLWPHAVEEGRVAAENALGKTAALRALPTMNSISVYGHSMISCGLTAAGESLEGLEVESVRGAKKREFRRYVLRDGRLVGFILAGDVSHAGVLLSLILKQVDLSGVKDRIFSGGYNFSSLYPLIRENAERFNEPEYREVAAFL